MMKALTICQPYAHLIVHGLKVVENRTWPTTYRGPILIHAGKSKAWLERDDTGSRIAKVSHGFPVSEMPFGAIVGIANFTMCLTKENILQNAATDPGKWTKDWKFLAEHEHTEGPWCWVLESVRCFKEPVSFKGALGIFDVPEVVVRHALTHACEAGMELAKGVASAV